LKSDRPGLFQVSDAFWGWAGLGRWPEEHLERHVPLFYFRICNGNYSGTSGEGFNLADRDAAWAEMTRVCSDLVGGIARKLQPRSEWRMELLDESRKPVFRIRVLGETLDLKALPGE
jgi:hypothetical protein